MAVRALPPGVVKRRTLFGLLDADGWTAAFFKALFWFLVIIFLLGYVPDRAYYFTVSKTIDLGFNAVPIVNFCPGSNEDLRCPAPVGALVPWQASPSELALPQPRSGAQAFQSGTNLYIIGGLVDGAATADTLATIVTTEGNLDRWMDGAALPEPRSDFAFASLSGVPYVVGGLDASGAPTDTVFQGVVEEGVLTGWETPEGLTLPVAMSDAMAVSGGTGIYIIGGRTAEGLSPDVWVTRLSEGNPRTLGAWEDTGLPLSDGQGSPQPRADGMAVAVGETVYVAGGEGPDGITRSIFRLELDDGEPLQDDATGRPLGWASAPESQQLPEARARAASFTANGTLYILGGVGEDQQPQASSLWAVPETTSGNLPSWQRLDPSDLPAGRAGGAVTNVGSFAFLIGGEDATGPLADTLRANASPAPPFFRFGLFGMTIPALAIQGEIGQQLGYINAAGVGGLNFVVLILIGLAYSHPKATMRVVERVSRGRFRAPRDAQGYPGEGVTPAER